MRRTALVPSLALLLSCAGPRSTPPDAGTPPRPPFSETLVMIPMRDGVRLETAIFAPEKAPKPLPILFLRSPYGIPPVAKLGDPSIASLVADGYIFVVQNLRGRFKSEGTFVMARAPRDPSDPRAIDEASDAYDTIDWLVKNVPNHNGRVGMTGTSYAAWTATMALLDPHPALKAVVEEASPADQFIGDDFHHNGAFRLAYGFEYVALLESTKERNTQFKFDRGDTYDFYLHMGKLADADERLLGGQMPTWRDFVAHPNNDSFWTRQSFAAYLEKTTVPVLNVSGWWDQEDFYGPFKIHELLERNDNGRINHLVAGPWSHGGWYTPGRTLGAIDFGDETGTYYRAQIKAPWLKAHLHGDGAKAQPEAVMFETGSNRWRNFDRWPPDGVTPRRLYLRAGRKLSFEPPVDTGADATDSYVSDPASPVPHCARPIAPLFQGSKQWPEWLVADQRFADGRPDVLSYATEPLTEDVAVNGRILVELHASTTGTDSDWIVKLIDVYPEGMPPEAKPAPDAGAPPPDMRGYQLMVAAEVLRGRFRDSFERPTPIPAGKVVKYTIDLLSHAHVFRKSHKIMVQVQSTWFPVIDRNPQRYVDNIFQASEEDFVAATQRVSRSREAASAVVLPVVAK